MRMTRMASLVALAVFAAGVSTARSEGETPPGGKDVFLKFRCNSCHTVQALKIEKKASEEDEEVKGDRKPGDLSGVGLKHKAEWMSKYMLKLEKIEGQTHGKKFRGSKAELDSLSAWMATLKTDLRKKK